MDKEVDSPAWAIVLAGGDGRRLADLTRSADGTSVPKQFCSMWGGPSLLLDSLRRARSVTPPRRVGAVVAAQHRSWWQAQLTGLSEDNAFVQPLNRGTAIGALLAALHIHERDPLGRLIFLPADHHVGHEALLTQAIRQADREAARHPHDLVLVGLTPDEPDPELGYLVPETFTSGTARVAEFVEKPSAEVARELIDRGALWNTFIVCAQVQAVLGMFGRRYPEVLALMRRAVREDRRRPDVPTAAALIYETLPTLDFSRDLVRGEQAFLRVLRAPACGWSDLGCMPAVTRLARRGDVPRAPIGGRAPPLLSMAARVGSSPGGSSVPR